MLERGVDVAAWAVAIGGFSFFVAILIVVVRENSKNDDRGPRS